MIESGPDPGPELAPAAASVPRPGSWNASRLRELRYRLGLTQGELAAHLNVSRQSLKAWEQGQKRPAGAVARLLDLAAEHPEWVTGVGTASTLEEPNAPVMEHALTLKRVAEREYPAWWRERIILRLAHHLLNEITRVGNRFALLSAPCADAPETLAAARRALGPGPCPDLMIIPRAAATVGRWSAITSVRLTVDVLPTSRPATGPPRNLTRWPGIDVMERWTVDPFTHWLTVWRVDKPTRHHTVSLEWHIEPVERTMPIPIQPFFLSFAVYPRDWDAYHAADSAASQAYYARINANRTAASPSSLPPAA